MFRDVWTQSKNLKQNSPASFLSHLLHALLSLIRPDLVPVQVRDGVGGPAGLLSDLTASDKTVHADFYNNFGDLFDDNDLN